MRLYGATICETIEALRGIHCGPVEEGSLSPRTVAYIRIAFSLAFFAAGCVLGYFGQKDVAIVLITFTGGYWFK